MKRDPSKMTEAQRRQFLDALGKEKAAIIQAIGEASLMWSALEGNLASCFSLLTFAEFGSEEAGVIFYSPNNFEGRLRLLDDMLMFKLPKLCPDALSRWETIKGKIKGKQNQRNAIAHGTFTNHGNIYRLSPAMNDTLRMAKAKERTWLPGMSSNDIRGFTAAVGQLCDLLITFGRLIAVTNQAKPYRTPPEDREPHELIALLDSQIEARSKNSRSS